MGDIETEIVEVQIYDARVPDPLEARGLFGKTIAADVVEALVLPWLGCKPLTR